MEITSLELSGFRNFEKHTQLELPAISTLFQERPEIKKEFILQAILGIIFGFTQQEKTRYRGDTEINKTFTGVITLRTEDRTLMIERDFETDFIACLLSDTKTTRPVFQGKDYVDNGYSRPYLQMLKSIFLIVDKQLFLDICLPAAKTAGTDFKAVLNSLYILLTPQFKFSAAKYAVNEANSMLGILSDLESTNPLETLNLQRQSILQTLKIIHKSDMLENDLKQLEQFIYLLQRNGNGKLNQQRLIAEKFPTIKDFNPLSLRADALMWKSLLQVKTQHEEELRAIRFKKNRLKNILDTDLYEYRNLPDTFSRDANRFKELDIHISSRKSHLKKYEQEIADIETKLTEHNRLKKFMLFSIPPLLFVVSWLILGSFWLFIIPETLLVFLAILAVSGHSNYKWRSKIFRIQEEIHILQKLIRDQQKEKDELLKKYPILKDTQYLDSHLERHRKFRQYKHELRSIEKEEKKIQETLNSELYTSRIEQFQQKYGTRIDISRPDLEQYLDEFVALKTSSKEEDTAESPNGMDELENLRILYQKSIAELRAMRKKLVVTLKLEDNPARLESALEKIDQQLKGIQINSTLADLI